MSEINKYGSFVVIEIFGLLQFMYQLKKMWQILIEFRKFNENIEWMLDKEIFYYLI